MNNYMFLVINIIGLLILIGVLYNMQKKYVSFSKRVFTALGLGIVYGLILHYTYGPSSEVLALTKDWFNIVGSGYVSLLKMIVMPLVFVSIVSAIINLSNSNDAGKMAGNILITLLSTAAVAAGVGIVMALLFNLNANDIVAGADELKRGEYLLSNVGKVSTSLPQKIISFIPSNPFLDLTGARGTSTIATVIFSAFLGISVLGIKKKKPASAQVFIDFINSLHDIVMRMVTLVLRLTPFGILALITNMLATSDFDKILQLIRFVIASYSALFTMFGIHLLILVFLKLNPIIYVKKVTEVLTFAFSSRSSAGTIPLTAKVQEEKLGVPTGIANMAATFGSTIGQNGCAAIYPAMVAVMIAPTIGIDPTNIGFIVRLILIVTISSLGVAGVGGGATFAAIIVLSSLNFPIELVGLLISIEPLIDMGRTALNVNDSILAGVVTSRVMNKLDKKQYDAE